MGAGGRRTLARKGKRERQVLEVGNGKASLSLSRPAPVLLLLAKGQVKGPCGEKAGKCHAYLEIQGWENSFSYPARSFLWQPKKRKGEESRLQGKSPFSELHSTLSLHQYKQNHESVRN